MKVILALLAICLIAPCLAEPQTVTTGPYTISFDLGISNKSYLVNVSTPKTNESVAGDISTEYQVELQNNTGIARMATFNITEYQKNQTLPTPDEMGSILKYALEQLPKIRDVQTNSQIIDGVNGSIASGTFDGYGLSLEAYVIMYNPTPRLSVVLTSTYPWDEGTSQLLNTTHVAKTA